MEEIEAIRFLNNKKVYVDICPETINNKLLALGYKGLTDSYEIRSINAPFIFINDNFTLTYSNDYIKFKEDNKYSEIKAEEIISMVITKTTPCNVKDDIISKECYEELKKLGFKISSNITQSCIQKWLRDVGIDILIDVCPLVIGKGIRDADYLAMMAKDKNFKSFYKIKVFCFKKIGSSRVEEFKTYFDYDEALNRAILEGIELYKKYFKQK